MSNVERFDNLVQIVRKVEPEFNSLAQIHNAVNFKKEALFAQQILRENDYLAVVAMGNQDSFRNAIMNVAQIGLTLSPAMKLAYLVPRDKKIYLDISYRGYVQLATEKGAIMWANAEVVRANDYYLYQGMGKEPIHKFDPFSDRGEIRGAYCLAKTHAGEFIITQMSYDEIKSIRDRSPGYKAYLKDNHKNTPWISDEVEMIKKTLIKRAWKSWPMTDSRLDRLAKAIEISDQIDPIDVGPTINHDDILRSKNLEKLRENLKFLGRSEEKYLEYAIRIYGRSLKKLEEMTDLEINQAVIALDQMVESEKQKKNKLEELNHEES